MKNIKLYVTLLFLLINSLPGQWKFELSNYSVYDDNIFKNYKQTSDIYQVPGLNLSRTTQNMEFYLNGYSFLLQDNTVLNNGVGTLGFDYYTTLDKNLFATAGLDYTQRVNSADYDYYDYFKLQGHGMLKWYSMKNGLSRIYVNLQAKRFPVEEAWNHFEFALRLQHNLYLMTGTTLRFELMPMVRNFMPYSYEYEGISYPDELPTLWQAKFNFRVAQSISQNFGGYTEFQYRYNPSETNPYDPVIQGFSPIDDYFGYGGYEWHTSLKYKLTENIWLKSAAELYRDIYKNRAIYDYDFATGEFVVDSDGYYVSLGKNRKDSGFEMIFGISYKISKLFNLPSELFLELEYTNRVNESNDPYFDYENNSVSMQLNYNFQF